METSEPEVVTVGAGRGVAWVAEGFQLFRSDWLSWIGLSVLLVVLSMVAAIIPVANILVPVVTPIIIAGLMLACAQQKQGDEISIALVFSGFSRNPAQLALIGVFYFVANILIIVTIIVLLLVILGGFDGLSQLSLEDPELLIQHLFKVLLVLLIGLSMYLPVVMALWFAPALVVFKDLSAVKAIALSIRGCLLNVLPFLIYGIVTMLLMILASIPFMLGWLILLPILIASVYASYSDIYLPGPGQEDSARLVSP